MDIVERLRMCNDAISSEAGWEIERLRLLLISKNEALAIVASPRMWFEHDCRGGFWWTWNGTGEFADPRAWAKREAEAEEPTDG